MNFNNNIKKESYWKNINLLNDYFISKLLKNRKKIYKIFLDEIQPTKKDKILDIGATPSLDIYENFKRRWNTQVVDDEYNPTIKIYLSHTIFLNYEKK